MDQDSNLVRPTQEHIAKEVSCWKPVLFGAMAAGWDEEFAASMGTIRVQ